MHGAGGVDLASVVVSPRPTLYRPALGRQERGGAGVILGILGASLGGMSLVTGAALLPVGLAKDNPGLTFAGEITLAAGAVVTALGIWGITNDPFVEQAGAGYGVAEGAGVR